jgi:hypothetical protein
VKYAGKQVCVSGFLGQMVPYGEDQAELFATREQALSRRAPVYLHVGFRLTLKLQPLLAKHSGERAMAVGTFDFDRRCWPQTSEGQPATCFPRRPMSVHQGSIIFADGTRVP